MTKENIDIRIPHVPPVQDTVTHFDHAWQNETRLNGETHISELYFAVTQILKAIQDAENCEDAAILRLNCGIVSIQQAIDILNEEKAKRL